MDGTKAPEVNLESGTATATTTADPPIGVNEEPENQVNSEDPMVKTKCKTTSHGNMST